MAQDFCSSSRRRNGRIASYATVSTTQKTDKKTSQDSDIIKSSLLNTLSELSERERLLSYYKIQLDSVERKILSNSHLTFININQDKKPNSNNSTINENYVQYNVPAKLVDERNDLDKKYTEMEQRIIQGIDIGNDKQESTNSLMASLILFATLTGSLVQSLRETNEEDNLPKSENKEEKLSDFLIRISSGLGAGIVCALFLTSNGWSSTEAFELFPSLGSSLKTLIGFLVGMFSKDLYELLADSVPAIFKFVRTKIPGIK